MGGPNAEQRAQQEAAREEERASILGQILTAPARERLAHIALVKQEKARAVEDMLIGAAKQGKLRGQVTEDQFIEMLEGVSGQYEKKTKVTIQRRKCFGDSDSDNDDDLLG